ncbi:MAG: AtpZ/AtpI family protein [Gemmatimonadota bacterium]|nr:MAG: AtpZ/AtpI family protein [Gemmatimonadota bacterium]
MQVPDEDRRKVGAYLGLGWGFAGAVGLFVGLGWLLDRWLGVSPVFTVIGVFVGGAAGFYYLVRQAFEIQKGDRAGNHENDGGREPPGKAPDRK